MKPTLSLDDWAKLGLLVHEVSNNFHFNRGEMTEFFIFNENSFIESRPFAISARIRTRQTISWQSIGRFATEEQARLVMMKLQLLNPHQPQPQ